VRPRGSGSLRGDGLVNLRSPHMGSGASITPAAARGGQLPPLSHPLYHVPKLPSFVCPCVGCHYAGSNFALGSRNYLHGHHKVYHEDLGTCNATNCAIMRQKQIASDAVQATPTPAPPQELTIAQCLETIGNLKKDVELLQAALATSRGQVRAMSIAVVPPSNQQECVVKVLKFCQQRHPKELVQAAAEVTAAAAADAAAAAAASIAPQSKSAAAPEAAPDTRPKSNQTSMLSPVTPATVKPVTKAAAGQKTTAKGKAKQDSASDPFSSPVVASGAKRPRPPADKTSESNSQKTKLLPWDDANDFDK